MRRILQERMRRIVVFVLGLRFQFIWVALSAAKAHVLDKSANCGTISSTMDTYSGHPSNCIPESVTFTALHCILGDTGRAKWPMTETAEVASACIAGQASSDLTALYQHYTTSPAEFSAVLWPVLGYEPILARGGGTRK